MEDEKYYRDKVRMIIFDEDRLNEINDMKKQMKFDRKVVWGLGVAVVIIIIYGILSL